MKYFVSYYSSVGGYGNIMAEGPIGSIDDIRAIEHNIEKDQRLEKVVILFYAPWSK